MELEPLLQAPRTADEDTRRAWLALPTFEIRELLNWTAKFPVTVKCTTPTPALVFVMARETLDAEATVQCSTPSFVQKDDGIRLPAVTGITTGTRYDVRLFIVGVTNG